MTSKSLIAGLVGIAAVVAAGAGGYLALRMNAPATVADLAPEPGTSVPASSTTPAATPDSPGTAEPDGGSVGAPARETRSSAAARPANTARATRPAPPAPMPEPAGLPPLPPAIPATGAALPAQDPPTPLLAAMETPPIPEVVPPQFEEVTIGEDAVIGIRLDQTVTSETARVEDRVSARVSRDVTVNGRTAVPAGARLEGVVAAVERGGKMRERARIGIRFNTLILLDSTRVPIQTAVIFREGDSPAGEAGSKIGASAVVGAILGAVIGGKKGAAIGTAAGAAGGTAAVMAGDVNHATIAAGAPLTLRLTAPVIVLIERDAHHEGSQTP